MHISVEEAFNVALAYATENGELSEAVYEQIAKKLTDEEQNLFVAMLTGRGIKVLPVGVGVVASGRDLKSVFGRGGVYGGEVSAAQEVVPPVSDEKYIEDMVEFYKKRILENVVEGEILQERMDEILREVVDPVVRSRLVEWIVSEPGFHIKRAQNSEYQKRVRRRVKKITGEEALRVR
jgi:hypothetical protein